MVRSPDRHVWPGPGSESSCCLLTHVPAVLVDSDKSLHLQVFNDGVEIINLVELLLSEMLLNLLDGLAPRGVERVEDSISDCAMLYAPTLGVRYIWYIRYTVSYTHLTLPTTPYV